jgi:hypothetical protein
MGRRGAVILVVAALAAAIGAVLYLNVTGFCYSQKRYFSDADLIRQAVLYSLRKPPREVPDAIKYESVEAFMDRNRDCCVVHREDRGDFENILADRWVRIIGWYVLVVDLWYQFKESGPDNFYEVSIAINSCGEFVERAVSLGSRPRRPIGN